MPLIVIALAIIGGVFITYTVVIKAVDVYDAVTGKPLIGYQSSSTSLTQLQDSIKGLSPTDQTAIIEQYLKTQNGSTGTTLATTVSSFTWLIVIGFIVYFILKTGLINSFDKKENKN